MQVLHSQNIPPCGSGVPSELGSFPEKPIHDAVVALLSSPAKIAIHSAAAVVNALSNYDLEIVPVRVSGDLECFNVGSRPPGLGGPPVEEISPC